MECNKCGGPVEEVLVSEGRYNESEGDHYRCKDCGHKQRLLDDIFSI